MADSINEEYLVAGASKEMISGRREKNKEGPRNINWNKEIYIFTSGTCYKYEKTESCLERLLSNSNVLPKGKIQGLLLMTNQVSQEAWRKVL